MKDWPVTIAPRTSLRIVLAMLAMIAMPAALTLHTVRAPAGSSGATDVSPYGYTVSLLLFIVPILVIGFWFMPREGVKISREVFCAHDCDPLSAWRAVSIFSSRADSSLTQIPLQPWAGQLQPLAVGFRSRNTSSTSPDLSSFCSSIFGSMSTGWLLIPFLLIQPRERISPDCCNSIRGR